VPENVSPGNAGGIDDIDDIDDIAGPAPFWRNKTMSEIATLAGGCFWCLEAVYDQMQGVESVESGYIGGAAPHPTYEAVCSGRTGHAEAVRITFDPAVVSYRELLEVFFVIHDPTTLNRQGNDSGTQYRSAIYYHSPEQKATAEAIVAELNGEEAFPRPIVTEITPADTFYEAEAYHQEYFAKNPGQGYCSFVVAPKVAKFRKHFAEKMKVTA
jgi:peptide-methionine (S)-S-oxide reductase